MVSINPDDYGKYEEQVKAARNSVKANKTDNTKSESVWSTHRSPDGSVTMEEIYINSDGGKTVRTIFDKDDDGQADYINVKTYDQNGRLSSEEFDNNADGKVDLTHQFEYNKNGQKTSFRISNEHGTQMSKFEYNDKGVRTREEHDLDGDGKVDTIITFGLDSKGYQSVRMVDNDGDGTVDTYEPVNNTADKGYAKNKTN